MAYWPIGERTKGAGLFEEMERTGIGLSRVFRQGNDTHCTAIDKNVSTGDVSVRFLRSASRLDGAPAQLDYPPPRTEALEADPQAFDPSRIGMVVASPPCPNADEYRIRHKHRMYRPGLAPLAGWVRASRTPVGAAATE